MAQNVELASFDLRYEGRRLRHEARESRLLASIAQRGIEEPVAGVDTPQGRLLLDGFKRYRCARKLNLDELPYLSLGPEEADGIVSLMRASTDQALSILEQARFVVDLLTIHELSLADVAETLSRSKGWVSMRRTLLEGMSEGTRQILFRGVFPVYSYMYTLRPFRRMNGVSPEQIEQFIQAGSRQAAGVRRLLEGLSMADLRGRVPAAAGWDQERALQSRRTAPAAASAQTPQEWFPAGGTAAPRVGSRGRRLCMSQQEPPLPQAEVDDHFRERPAYLEGCLTDEPDLSLYDRPADDEEDEPHDPDGDDQPPESENPDG